MNKDSIYAFYGSLRRGLKLYETYQTNLEYWYSMWLPGYDLFALKDYPCAVRSNSPSSKILIEVMRVKSLHVAKEIYDIEINAGYFLSEIRIKDTTVGIYLFHDATNYKRVDHGDWVKFFGDGHK